MSVASGTRCTDNKEHMTQLAIPTAWLDTMSRVRSVLPSAFLAGGALRDLDNGRPVKDLDVFFTEGAYDTSYLEDGLAKLGYFYNSRCAGAYMTDAAGEVGGTTTYVNTDGLPELNLIQLDPSFNPASIVERVDFGLCQIGYDLMGVISTAAYQFDKVNQRFTLTRAESVEGVMRSLKRYDRLSQKYPGWELYWGAEFDALVQETIARRSDNIATATEF